MELPNQNVKVISKDAVDLNLLPTVDSSRVDRIVPLWTLNNLERRNNEYFTFEIKSIDSDKSVKDQMLIHEFEKTICHICDIEVPKPFFTEHQKSLRHKTNVKIANVAIHRMKKYINNTDNEGYTDYDEINSSIYFCAICATVIDAKEQNTHDKSLAHKNSLNVEKIFNDFLIFYQSNKEVNNEKTETNIEDSKANIHDAIQNFVYGVDDTSNSSNKANKLIEKPIDVKQNGIPKKVASLSVKENKTVSLKDYLASLNRCVNHPIFFKVHKDNNLIEIETIDGSIVKVKEENFHGFNRVGKRHMQCFACKQIFKKEMLEEHKMSEKHIQCMITPLKDKHCARQIDNTLSHCLICNTITENADLHSLCDKDHWNYLKEALILSENLDEDYTTQEFLTHQNFNLDKSNYTVSNNNCRDNIDKEDSDINQNDEDIQVTKYIGKTDITSLETNISGGPSVIPSKYFCTACNEYISTNNATKHNKSTNHNVNTKSKYHYLMKEVNNELICKVCDVTLTNNIEHIQKHIVEEQHIKKCKQLCEDNKIVKINKNVMYCKPCDEIILIRNELVHIKTESHRAKCFPIETISEGTEKNEHNDKVLEKKQVNIHIELFKCELCNINLPKCNYDTVLEHMNGGIHSLNVEIRVESDPTSDINKKLSEAKIRNHMESTKHPNILNCKMCNLTVFNDELSISLHLNNVQHTTNHRKLLTESYMVFKWNNCYCNLCKTMVGIDNEIQNAFGKKHKRNLQQMLALLNSSPDGKTVVCNMCNKSLAYSKFCVINHINGMRHRQVYNALLKEEQSAFQGGSRSTQSPIIVANI